MYRERERSTARMSVNKLGEYMTATASRRRRIIQDQKRPKDFIVPRYTEAQVAIATFLAGGAQDDAFLRREIDRIMETPATSEWEEQRKLLCAEAIDSFINLADSIDTNGLTLAAGANDQPSLAIARVEISVRPEVTVNAVDRNGETVAGAIKLYFSKHNSLDVDSGVYVATTVHQLVDEYVTETAAADYRRCQVIDVFAGEVYTAPRSYVRRRRDIEAACEEIARAWPDL
jgi:hypothetical protein